jgi:hypothetical protein
MSYIQKLSSVVHDSIVCNKVTHGVGSQGSVPNEVLLITTSQVIKANKCYPLLT